MKMVTMRMDESLHLELKLAAYSDGMTVQHLVTQLVEQYLDRRVPAERQSLVMTHSRRRGGQNVDSR